MNKRIDLPTHDQRVVISEVLPYEIPPIFSDRRLYRFLVEFEVKIIGERIFWTSASGTTAHAIRLLIGANPSAPVRPERAVNVHSLPFKHVSWTIPYTFPVGRNDGQNRELSVCHPRNQIDMIRFYATYGSTLLGVLNRSPISLRKPVAMSKYTYADDQLHQRLRSVWSRSVETADREYESIRSYFVYETYDNIYKFYESREYQELEKKYKRAARFDISKCFDTIYTHSVAWALYGKDNVKKNLNTGSFGEEFDSVMQKLNYNETNGIIVGPEFSRLFAETILQTVDLAVVSSLAPHQIAAGNDFEIRRYVDDYFVFSNHPDVEDRIEESLAIELKKFNLHLNMEKRQTEITPTITPLSIAKMRVSRMLRKRVATKNDTDAAGIDIVTKGRTADTKKLITEYKLILRETSVKPAEILNYTLAVLEKRVVSSIRRYGLGSVDALQEKQLIKTLITAAEFAFFAYASSPRVNPTVKLSRIITHIASSLPNLKMQAHAKRAISDLLFAEILGALEKPAPSQHLQIENLFLWTALGEFDARYLLSETTILQYFGISSPTPGVYEFGHPLGHFSMMTLLHYLRDRKRYSALRNATALHLTSRVKLLSTETSERSLLLLDAIACPHLTDLQKIATLEAASIRDPTMQRVILASAREWFISWKGFDLGRELDLKRNQEVY